MNPIDRAASLSTIDLSRLLARNLEEGAVFVQDRDYLNGDTIVRLAENRSGQGGGEWFRLSDEASLQPLLTKEGFIVEDVSGDGNDVLLSFFETSFASYGYAQPVRRLRGQKRRKVAIRESVEGIKGAVRDNRALLKHFILLSDEYRKNPQLSSKEAKASMQSLMRGLYDSGSGDIAASYGAVEFEPDVLSWVSLFDVIGEQTLAQFLGIDSVAEIPGADINQRADEIRQLAGADDVPPDEPEKILASRETGYAGLSIKERMRRADIARNPVMGHYNTRRSS